MGEFEEEFLAIPAEVIRLTIRANQKCFVTRPTSPLWGGRDRRSRVGGVHEGPGALATPTPDPSPTRGRGIAAALQPLRRHRQYRGERRRRRDRLRQRQGGARAALRRALFLEDRPGRPARPRPADGIGREVRARPRTEAARPAHGPPRPSRRHLPRQARHAGRARGAHPAAGGGTGADRRRRSCASPPARPCFAKADLHDRGGGRVPRTAGPDGPQIRACCRASIRPSPPRSRSTTSRSGRPTSCRPTRCRSPWRWPTSSTCSSASGPIDEKPTGCKDPYALTPRGAGRDQDFGRERGAAGADAGISSRAVDIRSRLAIERIGSRGAEVLRISWISRLETHRCAIATREICSSWPISRQHLRRASRTDEFHSDDAIHPTSSPSSTTA